MKKIVFMFALYSSILLGTLNASEYLFKEDDLKMFGGFDAHSMKLNEKSTNLYGGGFSWLISESLYAGFRGYSNKDGVGLGGIDLGYMYNTNTPYEPFTSVLLGYGGDGKSKDNNFQATIVNMGIQIKFLKNLRLIPYISYINTSDNSFSGVGYGIRIDEGTWKKYE